MGKYKKLREDIEKVTNRKVIKQVRISRAALLLLFLSVMATIGGMSYEDPNSAMPTFLFTAAVFLFLIGIIQLFVNRSKYLFRPTKSKMKEITLYFDIQENIALQTCIEMKRFEELGKLKRKKDAGIKLEAMIASDHKFAAIQVSEYVPYAYETVTPVLCYYGKEAGHIASYVKS